MSQLLIPLLLTPEADFVCLRSICGADELAIEDTATSGLLNFLEPLLKNTSNGSQIKAAQIVTSDRDRLLAMLYISIYGPKIESTISCERCKEKFDLSFSLNDLLHYHQPSLPKSSSYKIEPGIQFRLPTGEDEMLLNGLSQLQAEQLLFERCLVEGNPINDKEKVQLKMSELAPVLNLSMESVCPECTHSQLVQFDIQSFFLNKLKQERPVLINEVHCIASTYHWSQQEILSLPRGLRKHYATLIQNSN